MASRRVNTTSSGESRARRAALTPQARENQMIDLAVTVAEDMMMSGNAPAQIVTHYLKLGSSREVLEQERIRMQVALDQEKIERMKSEARVEELYTGAIEAMRRYQGSNVVEDVEIADEL